MYDDLSRLTTTEIDALPFGYIALAPDGTIRKYNRFEADLARKDPQEVLGRNFFREVAPCTQVQEFEGRFRELVSGATPEPTVLFDFSFGFRHGVQDVRIGFVRSPLENEVIVTVNRLRKLDMPLSAVFQPDAVRGGIDDAAGMPVTVANEDFWRALDSLWRHAPPERRREALQRLGREWGSRHARRVDRLLQRQQTLTLREAELQMAVECLSGSLGVLGLGRYDVRFEFRHRGVLVLDHRDSPFVRLFNDGEGPCCELLAGLHAGFLSYLSGRPLAAAEVRCGRSPGQPCTFVVGTQARLEKLLQPVAGSGDAELLVTVGGDVPALAAN
jgi:photoactive yellow protein